jgi:ssRNA-specific RNase YbeY (16S rRNA maturation enzyme)
MEEKHSDETEFYILLIHSILHILWFDHEKDSDYTIMNKFEKRIYKEVFEK